MPSRPKAAAIAAIAGALALLAAPAWSVLGPVPARTFSAAVPGGGVPSAAARAAGTAGVRVEPGKRFNLVGLSWRHVDADSTRVAFRVRRDGGWTPWMEATTVDSVGGDSGERRPAERVVTDPVWIGEADVLEVRSERPLPRLEATFENTTGTATAADRARTALRSAAREGVALLGGLLGADSARADDAPPRIIPRAQWEQGQCTPRRAPSEERVRMAFVHHTVSLNDYAAEDSAAIVLAICRYHRNSNGWNDIGYNFVVDKYGQVFEGRAGGTDRPVIGAHAQGWNSHSTGAAVIGTYSSSALPEPAVAALSRLLAWKLALHGVRPDDEVVLESRGGSANRYPSGQKVRFATVSGHRDAGRTSCPGDALYAQLPDIRQRAARFDFPMGAATGPRATLDAGRGAMAYRGLLTLEGRAPGAGREVTLEYDRAGRWRELEELSADQGGSFRKSFRVGNTHRYRAVVDGRPSEEIRVQVRPRLATLLRGARRVEGTEYSAEAGDVLRFYSRITPMKQEIIARLERLGEDGDWDTVERDVVETRRGRAWARFELEEPGRYRVRSLSFGDSRHASGRSHIRFVEVSE